MGVGGYAVGYHAIAHCKRCGDLMLRRKLVYDGQFPDLLVCVDCWDPKHPQDYLPDVYDPETIYRPTGDLELDAGNRAVVSYPPLKFLTGSDYPTSVFPNGPIQGLQPRLTSPVKAGGNPGTLSPPYKMPGMITFGVDTNDKFTIVGGGVTDE